MTLIVSHPKERRNSVQLSATEGRRRKSVDLWERPSLTEGLAIYG